MPSHAKCKWDISPTMHDLPSQCKSEGSPGHGQTGEVNFGEGLVRLSVNRVSGGADPGTLRYINNNALQISQHGGYLISSIGGTPLLFSNTFSYN